jgi:tetratricopeptide (TPR) repeat protein
VISQYGTILIVVMVLALLPMPVFGHDSPSHIIEVLDQAGSLTATQFHRRAVAHRASGDLILAVADLESAISREPQEISHRLELARTQLTAGNPGEALRAAGHAKMLATASDQRASVAIIQAEAYQKEKKYRQSLKAIQRAFEESPDGEMDWYLLRSESQYALGLHRERVADLAAGLKAHPGTVLKSHWIDALIEAGDLKTALSEINKELVGRRWKASYLIKKARVLTCRGKVAEAQTCLLSAVNEMSPRLDPKCPDLLLVSDLGVAHALLNHPVKAQSCLKLLQLHSAPDWVVARLQKEISP